MTWLRRRSMARRPLVLDAQQSAVTVEGTDHLASRSGLDRVAIFAHWAPDIRIDRSVNELTLALARNGYDILVVSTVAGTEPLDWPSAAAPRTILRRPNLGYDFGSWATALDLYPEIAAAEHVLLLNTSLVGPFEPIDHLIHDFEATPADVWGMTDSTQFGHHLQSYCLGFRGRCLQEGALARFWHEIRVEPTRAAVIEQGELGLGRLLARERYVSAVAIPSWRVVGHGQNPTIVGWRALLDAGFPFVKRQLLTEPQSARDSATIPEELRRRFGVAIEDWL
jgi:lipopolysaccharide biosynthesis protein